jgi:hypothetical protein
MIFYAKAKCKTYRKFKKSINKLPAMTLFGDLIAGKSVTLSLLQSKQYLHGTSSAEQAAIHSINYRLCRDLPAAKESSVQTLDGVFSTDNTLKLDVNVAGSIGIYSNVNNLAILFLTLSLDIIFEILDPAVTIFPTHS